MQISSLLGASGLNDQQNVQRSSARLQAVIERIVTGRASAAQDNVADLSVAATLQSSVSGLRQVSVNLAQAGSQVQQADAGITQIQRLVSQARQLSEQAANPLLNQNNRNDLNRQFQSLSVEIDRVAASTNFNGRNLLDGTFNLSLDNVIDTEGNSDGNTLSIPAVNSASLLGNKNLLSVESAQSATASLAEAQKSLLALRSDIGSFLEATDYASATVASAVNNFLAAQSDFSDVDLVAASSLFTSESAKLDVSLVLAAQGNRLPANVVKLIG